MTPLGLLGVSVAVALGLGLYRVGATLLVGFWQRHIQRLSIVCTVCGYRAMIRGKARAEQMSAAHTASHSVSVPPAPKEKEAWN